MAEGGLRARGFRRPSKLRVWARSKGVTATAILSFADRSLGASTWPDLERQIVRTPAVGHLRYSNSLLIIEDAVRVTVPNELPKNTFIMARHRNW